MITRYRLVLVSLFISLGGCSGGEDKTNQADASAKHVWKEQTNTIDKANEVNQLIQEAAEKQRRMLEEQSR